MDTLSALTVIKECLLGLLKSLLKKYTKIWEKVRNLMNIELDSEPVNGDNDKCIKTKIKMYEDKVNTNL